MLSCIVRRPVRPMQEPPALPVRDVLALWPRCALAVLIFVCLTPLALAKQDVAGGADHPLIARYDGAVILAHHASAFDEFDIATGPHTSFESTLTNYQTVEGAWTRLLYVAPEGRSTLDVLRNYTANLTELGFEELFTCRGRDCGMGPDPARAGSALIRSALLPREDLRRFGQVVEFAFTQAQDVRFLSARLDRPEGAVYVSVAVAVEAFDNFRLTANRVLILLDVIETGEVEERMVRVDPPAQPAAPPAGTAQPAPDFGGFTPPAAPGALSPTPALARPGDVAAGAPSQETIPLALTEDDRAFLEEITAEIEAMIAEIEERRIAMRARFAGEDLRGEIERAFEREGVSTSETVCLLGDVRVRGDDSTALCILRAVDFLPGALRGHEDAIEGVESVVYTPYVNLLETARDGLERRAGAIARVINWPDASPTPLTPAIRAGLRRDLAYLQGGQALWRGEEDALSRDVLPRLRAHLFLTLARLAFYGRETAALVRAGLFERDPDAFNASEAVICVNSLAFRVPAVASQPRQYFGGALYMPVDIAVSHLGGTGFQQPYSTVSILDHMLDFVPWGEACAGAGAPEDINPLLRLAVAVFPAEPARPALDEDGLGPELTEPRYEPVASIHYGHPVYVEAVFETAPAREAYSVTLETPFGRTGVLVERTQDNRLLYRSGPVVFAHADGRSAERTP